MGCRAEEQDQRGGQSMLGALGKTAPLTVFACGLCCGILVQGRHLPGALFALTMLALLLSRQRLAHAACGVLLGIMSVLWTPVWSDFSRESATLSGNVVDVGFVGGVFRVLLNEVRLDEKPVAGRTRLSVYKNVSSLRPGQRVRTPAKIRPARALGNAGEFDYRRHLLGQGITMQASVKDFLEMHISGPQRGPSMKHRLGQALSGLARPEAEVLKALLTGDRSGLVPSLRDRFTALGVAHLLAISGLHMGLVILLGTMAAFSLLRVIPPIAARLDTPRMARCAGLVGAIVFAWFVGPSIPTLRALIMAAVILGALFFSRRVHLASSLSLAAIVILMLWPLSIFQPGFLLSFAAVTGIIGVLPRVQGQPGWLQFMVITVVATGFTLPISAYFFGFVSPVGILANLVCVPLFSLYIMPLGLTGLILYPLSPPLADLLFSLTLPGLTLILRASEVCGLLVPVPRPPIVLVFLCYGLLILALAPLKLPSERRLLRQVVLGAGCVLLAVLPIIQHYRHTHAPLCFDFISVGQGDSTLVTKGPLAILIDAGGSFSGFDTGRYVVAPHLLRRGVTHLDLVIITHSHPDHIGGMPFILERFDVDEVWTNLIDTRTYEFERVLQVTKSKSMPVRCVSLGDTLALNDLNIEVFNPQRRLASPRKGMDLNLHSVVVRIGDRDMQGLFMGDADAFGEISICHTGRDLRAGVLKVAHHGSESSCQDIFLEKVRPLLAVIHCGYCNRYGVPGAGTLNRLHRHGIEVFRTDLHGEVCVRRIPGGLAVKCRENRADEISDVYLKDDAPRENGVLDADER